MNNNIKGTLGELKVLEKVIKDGWYAYPAFDDHSPVDLLVLNKTGKVLRLQIKYRNPINRIQSRRYELSARSMVNGKSVSINRNMIDGWAVYMADVNDVIFIPLEVLDNKNSINVNPDHNYKKLDDW